MAAAERVLVTWRNPSQAGNAPIAGIDAVCPATSDPRTGTGAPSAMSASRNRSVDRPEGACAGEWVARVWLRDAAGNEDRRSAADGATEARRLAARLGFKPLDAADPTRIDVRASDSISPSRERSSRSGVAASAHWLPLPTTSSADGFSGRLDDEHLPNGIYDFARGP